VIVDEPGVYWSAAFCARYWRRIDDAVRREYRVDCLLVVPDDLSEALWEMREVAARHRAAMGTASGTEPCVEPGTPSKVNADMGVEDLAARLNVTGSYVRRLARTGVLPGRRVGSAWVFGSEAVEAFEKERSA